MSAIDPAEIQVARADLDTMLPDLCAIQRATETSDGGGGQTTTWPTIASGVSCRVAAAGSGGTQAKADRLTDGTTHTVTFSAGTDVRNGDRLDTPAGLLDVLLVRSGGAWELTRRVDARIVTT